LQISSWLLSVSPGAIKPPDVIDLMALEGESGPSAHLGLVWRLVCAMEFHHGEQ
jgi:hypothetical protein